MSVPIRFTTRDLELFSEPLDDTRYEIIDGELHVTKQPRPEHQFVCYTIIHAIGTWIDGGGHGLVLPAPGVIFSSEDAVAPDVVWVRHASLRELVDDDHHIHVAPDLMVEVLSPGTRNERRDRELKLDLYSRYGVREYWIVDIDRQEIAVYTRRDAALRIAATLSATGTLTSDLLPGFSCPLSGLWPR